MDERRRVVEERRRLKFKALGVWFLAIMGFYFLGFQPGLPGALGLAVAVAYYWGRRPS